MEPHSLFASACINIGLAFFILSIFSILKRQPSNAPIYYARPLSEQRDVHLHHGFNLRRLVPSVSWILHALRVTDDQVLQRFGLDALVVLRLFKFGIRYFVICSLFGMVILLPVNYDSQSVQSGNYYSMDIFTISNVLRGSNRLWVHFSCLWAISIYGLYLLYKEYKEILYKRIQQLRKFRDRPDQLTVLVREVPLCVEHKAYGCCFDVFFSKHHPYTYYSHQMLHDVKDHEDLLNQAEAAAKKIDELRKPFPYKKDNEEPLLLDAPCADIALKEERLHELKHKLHQLQHESVLKEKELPVAFAVFKSRWGAAVAAQSLQHPHPLLWVTESAPEPRDVFWKNLSISRRILPLYKIGVVVAASLLTIFFAIPVTAVQGIAKFEKLKKWFPPAMAVQLIPGLRSVVTGYLPSAILKGFIYAVPFAMLALAQLSGCISKSKAEIRACSMVFYFLVGNVFFLSLLSGSLLDEFVESVSNPKSFPSRLASAVSAQADFFVTYILTDGLSGFSLEILQPGLLIWDVIYSCTYGRGKEKSPYVYPFPYFRVVPFVALSMLIGTVYAVVAPLVLPFLIVYFCLGYVVYINQMEDVYITVYETHGQFWPYIHHYIVVAIVLMQITMIGLFGLKSKPAAAVATIPLLLFTIMFNEYCKSRFLPSFYQQPLQTAMENDELDEENHQMEVNCEKTLNAYHVPCLQTARAMESESSSTQPV